MINGYRNEEWKDVEFDSVIAKFEKYKISNYGRILNCKDGKNEILRYHHINGYTSIPLTQEANGKRTSRYVHKLVAQHFLEKKEGDEYVIHLDYDKKNNHVDNLKWATKREKELHQYANEEYLKSKPKRTYAKLTEGRVKIIKRKLADPNNKTRLKMIAKQFGVSDMQIHRIKTGENWGSVTIDD
ncbi:NUMOD4 domain-containing protein [Wenyingzhuangia sp. 2_MG-2023]|uniref:NUMOD4 domain-containing protein n=1 Tax=Wenyingzhuangia sp. 2_MG-2023 TaxID=3062639 RepID=UPI0026E3C947|nr:NUMOD4 domain-containing protein [Wenyingzhuangia sp. 2_MG-2023]MDO6736658.1 NUMOD4 domain-containing protein [Wenyingzhuangia sp. 2_MG-2023]MDO6801047.1 NUMOD4 domain-containing protein [Wenyingzhuangia sp. 1_MG-2023]